MSRPGCWSPPPSRPEIPLTSPPRRPSSGSPSNAADLAEAAEPGDLRDADRVPSSAGSIGDLRRCDRWCSDGACTTPWARSPDVPGTSTGGPGTSPPAASDLTRMSRCCWSRRPNGPGSGADIRLVPRILARAVDLTRRQRQPGATALLAAAEAALMAGSSRDQALCLLDRLEPRHPRRRGPRPALDDPGLRPGILRREREPWPTVPAICQAAAAAFETAAPALARDALITAFERAFGAEWMMTGTTLGRARRTRRPAAAPSGRQFRLPDLVLAALGDSGSGTLSRTRSRRSAVG